MTNMPMTSFGKQEDPSRLETAYDTMVSPNTALVIKEEHYMSKPTHSRKLSYPEQSAFSQIEYAELQSNFADEIMSKSINRVKITFRDN